MCMKKYDIIWKYLDEDEGGYVGHSEVKASNPARAQMMFRLASQADANLVITDVKEV